MKTCLVLEPCDFICAFCDQSKLCWCLLCMTFSIHWGVRVWGVERALRGWATGGSWAGDHGLHPGGPWRFWGNDFWWLNAGPQIVCAGGQWVADLVTWRLWGGFSGTGALGANRPWMCLGDMSPGGHVAGALSQPASSTCSGASYRLGAFNALVGCGSPGLKGV